MQAHYVGAAALIGAGIASNNPTAMALGAAKLAQSGIQSLTQFGGLISSSSGLGQALGTIAPALPGIGLFAGGVAQGGIGGTLEATAGGAQAGLTLGGPVGAAIGAGVGLISGIVSTLIQGQSFAERVKQNMYNQAYRLPPSEQFSFAMGNSISADTFNGLQSKRVNVWNVRTRSEYAVFRQPDYRKAFKRPADRFGEVANGVSFQSAIWWISHQRPVRRAGKYWQVQRHRNAERAFQYHRH